MDQIGSIVQTIDSLRGFYLDHHINGIGTTGWDALHDFVNDVDMYKTTMDRYR